MVEPTAEQLHELGEVLHRKSVFTTLLKIRAGTAEPIEKAIACNSVITHILIDEKQGRTRFSNLKPYFHQFVKPFLAPRTPEGTPA